MTRIVLGTRGSELARAQTHLVEEGLRRAHPEVEVAVAIISTSADEKSGAGYEPAASRGLTDHGRKGLFTAEIERALLDCQIDVAVHSAKDLPSEPVAELEVCAAVPRAAVEDVLVAKNATDLSQLEAGATIATGSVRRQHQLRWLRPDLHLADLRGNVPTRMRKLAANPWEGIVLARAGLDRLGFDLSGGELRFEDQIFGAGILSQEDFVPAGGQGIIALQVRARDDASRILVASLNDRRSLLCLRAEREFLRRLQGDCGTPVGVLAKIENGMMTIRAQLFHSIAGAPRTATVRQSRTGQTPEALGAELWESING